MNRNNTTPRDPDVAVYLDDLDNVLSIAGNGLLCVREGTLSRSSAANVARRMQDTLNRHRVIERRTPNASDKALLDQTAARIQEIRVEALRLTRPAINARFARS